MTEPTPAPVSWPLGPSVSEQPPAVPAPIPARPEEKKLGIRAIVGAAVGILLAIAAFAWLYTSLPSSPPQEQETGEADYLVGLSNIVSRGSSSLTRYSNAINDWIDGYIDDASLLSLERNELAVIQGLRTELNALEVPCSAYQSMHNDLTSAFYYVEQAYQKSITGLETYDPDILYDASRAMDLAVQYLNSASGKLTPLSASVPNCSV